MKAKGCEVPLSRRASRTVLIAPVAVVLSLAIGRCGNRAEPCAHLPRPDSIAGRLRV